MEIKKLTKEKLIEQRKKHPLVYVKDFGDDEWVKAVYIDQTYEGGERLFIVVYGTNEIEKFYNGEGYNIYQWQECEEYKQTFIPYTKPDLKWFDGLFRMKTSEVTPLRNIFRLNYIGQTEIQYYNTDYVTQSFEKAFENLEVSYNQGRTWELFGEEINDKLVADAE